LDIHHLDRIRFLQPHVVPGSDKPIHTFPPMLSLKLIFVLVLLLTIFLHNVVYGRRIVRYAREGKIHELQSIRRWSRPVSYANVVIMLLITFLAILL